MLIDPPAGSNTVIGYNHQGADRRKTRCPRPDRPHAQIQGWPSDLRPLQARFSTGVGQIKGSGDLNRFRLRGLVMVNGEWALMATTHNLHNLCRASIATA